nr:hypothetical protein BaRGS_021766 [Batillaria attramentaria]
MVLRKDKGAYESSAIFVEAFGSFHIDFYQDDSEDNVEDAYGFEDGMGDADESLSPLQRLERYLDSDNIFNRQMVARSMLDTLRAVGDDKDSCTAVLDAMVRLSQDTEDIEHQVVNVILELASPSSLDDYRTEAVAVKDGEKHKVYKTHMDVVVSPSDTSHSGSVTQVTDGSSVQRRDMELGGVTIHTASVSTVSDADEETVDNIGSTHVLGHSLGQPTLAVVDGVVKADLSSGSISYMDSDFSPINHVDDAELAQQQDIVPQSLLENYLGMVEPSRAQTVDTEITRHCAYNIPAVAYTLGRQNWHCIKHLYETLSQAMQWKVRRTLAFSIHELAVIVGEEITHQDLLPVFDGFLKDLDEVRIGVLKHLADFLKRYLSKLSDFMKTDNHRNWRFRQELADYGQLCQSVLDDDALPPPVFAQHLMPALLALGNDPVPNVRLTLAKVLATRVVPLAPILPQN